MGFIIVHPIHRPSNRRNLIDMNRSRTAGWAHSIMTTLQNLTVEELRKLIAIKEQIASLTVQLESITGGEAETREIPKQRGRKKMTPSERGRIAVAARWAKVRAAKGEAAPKKKGKFSAAHRAALAAAQKARWATVKAEGKKRL